MSAAWPRSISRASPKLLTLSTAYPKLAAISPQAERTAASESTTSRCNCGGCSAMCGRTSMEPVGRTSSSIVFASHRPVHVAGITGVSPAAWRASKDSDRQFDLETGTHGVAVGGMNAAAGCFHDRTRDRQAKSAVLATALPGVVPSIGAHLDGEAGFKEMIQRIARKARAIVFDVEDQDGIGSRPAEAFEKGEVNSSSLRHGFRGVLDQVDQNSREVLACEVYRQRSVDDVDGDNGVGAGKGGEQIPVGFQFGCQVVDEFGRDGVPLKVRRGCERGRSRVDHLLGFRTRMFKGRELLDEA